MLVVSQTLQHGTREGVRVAVAPLLTDIPIICLGLILFSMFADPDFALGIVSFIGSAFVGYLGLSNLRQQPFEITFPQEASRSYLKGAATNILSPHPYLFWLSVGVPTVLKASSLSLSAALGFIVLFYVCIVGAKIVIAFTVGRSRHFLTGAKYLWIIKGLGLLLIGFALILLYDGLSLTGLVQ